MLITKIVTIDGSDYVYNYSDAKKIIRKVGTDELYYEAYDPVRFKDERIYEETDQDIPPKPIVELDMEESDNQS